MSSWARVGMKVVCVDNTSRQGSWWGDGPTLREVYTIKSIWIDFKNTVVFDFKELSRSKLSQEVFGKPIGYAADRFRPLISQSDDIAMFKAIADEASGKHRADYYKRRTQEIADSAM